MPQEPLRWTTILTLLITPSTKPNRNSSFPRCRTRRWKRPLAAQAGRRPILKRVSRRSVSGTPYCLRSSAAKLPTRDEAWRIAANSKAILSGGQNRLRCFRSISQRRFDCARIPAGIQCFARKEYGASIRFSQHRLRLPRFGSGIGISAACESIVTPVNRLRGHEIPRYAVWRQIENLRERVEPHSDELAHGKS